jgi:hypothetical protein
VDPGETDPANADTDGDGMDDGQELAGGFGPTVSNSFTHLSWTTGFEGVEGYSVGPLNGQQDWLASSSVTVQSSARFAGTNAVRLVGALAGETEMRRYFGAQGQRVVWFDARARLRPGVLPDPSSAVGSVLVAVNKDGFLCAYDSQARSWRCSGLAWRIDPSAWVRLTFRLDYALRNWSLYLDGSRILRDVPFVNMSTRAFSLVKARVPPSGAQSPDTFFDSLSATTVEPALLDDDNDGMPNSWEREKGFDPENAADRLGDPDGDELINLDEYRIGTDPFAADTDHDSVSDFIEVSTAFSDPLNADFDGSSSQMALVAGAAYTNAAGNWVRYGSSVYCLSRNGSAEYPMTVPSNGFYALELQATQFDPYAANNRFEFLVSVDGMSVGPGAITAAFGVTGKNIWFLPYLSGGAHSIAVRWDYRLGNGSLRIIAMRLLRLGGPDTNSNGVADWIDHRRSAVLDPVVLPATSLVSPVCYEGESGLFDALSLVSSYTPGGASPSLRKGVLNAWYANIPLSPTNDTMVSVAGDNGAVSYSNSIRWQAFNILSAPTNSVTLRGGDALLLTAAPAGATNGTVAIEIVGVTNLTTSVTEPVPVVFESAGVYTVKGTWSGSFVSNAQIAVRAVTSRFSGSPIVYVGRSRTWDCPDLLPETVVESDPRLTLNSAALSSGGVSFSLGIDAPGHRVVVARLGIAGPVLDSTEVVGVDIYSSESAAIYPVHTYADGTTLLEMIVHVTEVPSDLQIHIESMTAAVTMLDGSSRLVLNAADFDENGEAHVYFVQAPGWIYGACHTLTAYQNGNNIGVR